MLIIGGGGAVGFAAVQLAVAAGCHVSTTCGGQSVERALAAGAEQALDYTLEVRGLFCYFLFHLCFPLSGAEHESESTAILKRQQLILECFVMRYIVFELCS